MKKLSCLLVLFTVSRIPCFSQTPELDSLTKLVPSRSGKELVDLYTKIADRVRYINADTSLHFAKSGLALAEELKYNTGIMAAGNAVGRALSTKGNYFLAQTYYSRGLEMARQQQNDSFTCRALIGIGNCMWQLGKHADALEKQFEALRLADQKSLPLDAALAKTSMGMIYQTQEKLDLSEKYVGEALVYLRSSPHTFPLLNAMHTLANTYGMQGKIPQAFALDQEALVIAERSQNNFFKSLFYDNMANCYLFGSPPDFAKAREYFLMTLAIDSSYGNKKQMSDSYKNLGMVYMFRQQYLDAIPWFERAVVLARESGFVQGEQSTYQQMAGAYRRVGMEKEAFAMLQNSMRLKDSLINMGSETRMAELQTFYETEKKQQQIELQQTQLSRKNYLIIGTIVTTILLALLGFSAWRRARLKARTRLQEEIFHQQELATKAVIEAEEKERQRIARDLHDGIGQMMSAAKMNLSAFESELPSSDQGQHTALNRIIGLVDESCRELRAVSHNMMPNALLKNSLASAVRDFIDKLDKQALKVEVYTEGLDQRLDNNTETVLYRVIQECVNNVIKHSGANRLDISLVREKDSISATIEDNGSGFDSHHAESANGIGLRNIYTRVAYLKGTVDIDSAPGRGTVVAIHVPLPE